jgi:putative transposase
MPWQRLQRLSHRADGHCLRRERKPEPPPARWSILRYGFGRRWRTVTARKGHQPEEIVAKLRQVDVLVWQGQSVADAVRSTGVSEVTCYRWRQEFGGLKAGQVRRLKEFETADARLRRAVADLTLDQLTLGEAASGNCRAPRVAAPAASRTFATSCRPPGAAPARRSASTARRGASSRGAGTTRNSSPPTSSGWPAGTTAAATAQGRRAARCAPPRRAGPWTASGSGGSGGATG